MFADALAAMAATIDLALGQVDATYTRGAASVDILITPIQRAAWAASMDDGLTTRVHACQVLIDPADLDFGAGPVDPAPGDQITDETATATRTWEVRPPAAGRPCFEWIDPYQTRLRVAVVLVATAPASSSA